MPVTIAIVNHKGGVGKTTSTSNLGAILAKDHRVLLVDMDPQGGLTTSFKINLSDNSPTVYECLVDKCTAVDAIYETSFKNLAILPATIDLSGIEFELALKIGFEKQLRRVLDHVAVKFDYVLIDCPPSLGFLTLNCIAAADRLIIPMQCEYLSMKALPKLQKIIDSVKISNPGVTQKILFTMFVKNSIHSHEIVSEIKKCYNTYDAVISRTVRFSRANVGDIPLAVLDPASEHAQAYMNVAKEIIDEVSPS